MTSANEGVGGKPVQIVGAWQSGRGPWGPHIFHVLRYLTDPPLLAGTEKIVSPAPAPALGGPDYDDPLAFRL